MGSQANGNTRDFNLYNIGWIAALPHELAAGRAMRDEVHDRPRTFKKNPNDPNSYDWGKIGDHYVVLASLPTAGIGSAAAAATAMITSFPHLRCVLMVGIGGGIPSKKDIRLGDIVVSLPDKTSGGVVQYDLGARRSEGKFERKGHLNQPPNFLISGIRSLQATHLAQDSDVPQIMQCALSNAKAKKMAKTYARPEAESDRLFPPSTLHVESEHPGCVSCSSEDEIHRAERESTDPEIHYGIIASGNSVIKDGIERDRIVEDVGEECLCFEMEAAGLMNNMPCVVIRGICDYSDAHKNDDWQRYAALTAAAYTKELLGEIDPVEVKGSSEVQELLKADKMEEILKWLSDDNQNAVHRGHLSMFLKGTCQEFFGSPKFDSWLCGKAKTLFCPGSPGTGKSTIAAAVIDHLNAFEHKVAFYYWSYIQQDPHPVDTFVRSILRQLIQGLDSFPSDLDILYRQEKKKHPPKMASSDDFRNLLTKVLPETGTLYIVVDALDECDRHYSKLMRILREMQSKRDIRLLATSRPLQGISDLFEGYPELPVVAQNNDLGSYLKEKCPSSNIFQESPHLWEKVMDVIIERVNGVFLLARLYAGSVNDIRCEADIEKFRESMGPTSTSDERLAQLYNKSLDRIEGLTERDCARAQKVIVWIAYAQGPLTSEALQHALAFNAGTGTCYKSWLVSVGELVDLCAGLVVWNRETDIVELVHLTTQEFFRTCHRPWIEIGRKEATKDCMRYLWRTYHLRAKDIKQDHSHQLLDYCINHWGDHVAQNQDCHRDEALLILRDVGLARHVCGFPMWRNQSSGLFHLVLYKTGIKHLEFLSPCTFLWAYFGLNELFQDLLDSENFLRGADQYACYQSVLQLAALRGHVATTKALVAYGKRQFRRVEFFKQNLKPAFLTALSVGNAPIAEVLLKSGADASKEDLKEVLLKVISAGSLPGIKLLLDHGAFHENALVAAARSGSVTVMNLLLDRGIDEKCGKYDKSALWAAIDRGDREMVKLLLDKGPDGERGHALEQAANLGSQEIVRLLLERGVDVKHDSGGEALVRAAGRGSQEIVRLLLESGVDVKHGSGGEALARAAGQGSQEIVRLLLESGVDVKHGSGGEALARAAGRGSQEIVRLLLDEGSDVDFDDGGSHNAALAEAVCMKEYEMVKLLLDEGANINHDGRYGTALKIAANKGSWEMVSLLLDRGADVSLESRGPNEAQRSKPTTALFEASRNGHSDIVRLLLSNGASLEDGVLHIAAMYGHIDTMEALLNKGADIDATAESKVVNGLYGTPLYHAQFGWVYNLEAIRFLLARGANGTIPGSIAFKQEPSWSFAYHIQAILCVKKINFKRQINALNSVLLSGIQQSIRDLENHPAAQHSPQASVSVVTLMNDTKETIARCPNLESQEALERKTAQLLYTATDAAVDLLRRYHAEYTPEATAVFGILLEQIKDFPKRVGYEDEMRLKRRQRGNKDFLKRLGYGFEMHLKRRHRGNKLLLLRDVARHTHFHIRGFTCREGATTEVTVEFARIVQKIKDLEVLVFEAKVLLACTAE
ncbi:ankyrin repeat-containing domain protein [Apiospora arundinis]|uniref:Ankyrin repeat-containing domain protein n=1 Tax=Apiospora arundinis TaxID=335852 RepID=A0ABR2JLJ7_9PEZI